MARRFLFALLATVIFGSCSCARFGTTAPPLARYEFTRPEMGLPFRIVLYAETKTQADAAASAAFSRISQLNDIFSDYDPDSELSRLSRTSGSDRAVKVSDDLWNVLNRSQKLAAQTDGAFDITVGPAVVLWRKARREHQMPNEQLLAQAREAIGYKKVLLNERHHTAELLAPNMRLDLGAIAKGYAVDEAQRVLRRNGITSALVAGGGDMAVSNPPPEKKGWRIEIAPLDIPDAPQKKFVLIQNVGLATSGDVFQHLELNGKRYSHIVDPRTGIGLTDHSLVTTIAKDCTTADSLATVVSVLGTEKGLKLIDRTSGAAAHLVRKNGERIEMSESKRFSKYYEP